MPPLQATVKRKPKRCRATLVMSPCDDVTTIEMSPNLETSTGGQMGRTAMSCKELRRAGVMERVKSGELKLVNAAVMMGLSYRQTKRLAKRYREVGAKGLKHGSAGRESNRRKPRKLRERVLRLVGKKYSGE